MRSRNVEIAEVGAVGFVEVVVAVVRSVVAARYHRGEQVFRFLRSGLEIELVEDSAKNSDMPYSWQVLEVEESEKYCDGTPCILRAIRAQVFGKEVSYGRQAGDYNEGCGSGDKTSHKANPCCCRHDR